MKPMNVKYFIDSNICVYLFDKDVRKVSIAENLFTDNAIISAQVLTETGNVLHKKLHFPKEDICEIIRFIRKKVEVRPITSELFDIAFTIFIRYKFSLYDSLIVAAALDANCSVLYSEDMQHNQVIEDKLTIVNPFV